MICFEDARGSFTARKERRQRGALYWIAYRKVGGKLCNAYLGKAADLTLERLQSAAVALAVLPRPLDRPRLISATRPKDEVAAANLACLHRYAPNLTDDKILAMAIKSPPDLERINMHNWHGSCHDGDMGPAQSGGLRLAPGWAEHRLPIAGLYQTGATTHPGASVSAGPGRNAAMVILHDLGIDFPGAEER